jgi:hypothetical protein
MKSITFLGQRYPVEIVSLILPRKAGLMARAHPVHEERANVTLLSDIELPLGEKFILENADHGHFTVRVLGCSARPDGKHVIVGLVLR